MHEAAALSPEQAASAMRALVGSLGKSLVAPLSDFSEHAERQATRDFRDKSPGRSIFAAKKPASSTPELIVDAMISRSSGDSTTVSLVLKGMAALIETGGKTKPPRRGAIRPVQAKVLRFHGPRGVVFAAKSQHRGSRVPKQEIGRLAVESASRALPRAIDASLQNAIRVSGLG